MIGVLRVQTFLPVLLAALLAGLVVAYFYHEHIREKKLQLRVRKLYASQLFEDMIPMLKFARRHTIEQLSVDKTGVVLRYLHSEGAESAFLMRVNGYAYLTVDQQEAMRSVLEECLPKLRDADKYHVIRKRVVLLNGCTEYTYQYTISNEYKSLLARAPYYDGTLQQQSW